MADDFDKHLREAKKSSEELEKMERKIEKMRAKKEKQEAKLSREVKELMKNVRDLERHSMAIQSGYAARGMPPGGMPPGGGMWPMRPPHFFLPPPPNPYMMQGYGPRPMQAPWHPPWAYVPGWQPGMMAPGATMPPHMQMGPVTGGGGGMWPPVASGGGWCSPQSPSRTSDNESGSKSKGRRARDKDSSSRVREKDSSTRSSRRGVIRESSSSSRSTATRDSELRNLEEMYASTKMKSDIASSKREHASRARDAAKSQLGKAITIEMPNNESEKFMFDETTTVKDLKVFLAKMENGVAHEMRLMHNDRELPVLAEGGALALLSSYVKADDRVQHLIPYSRFRGQSVIRTAKKDQYGNADGQQYDFGVNGAFRGLTVVVLHLYTSEGFDFSLPRSALEEKGFTLIYHRSPPDVYTLKSQLASATQLWLISNSSCLLSSGHLDAIRDFSTAGKGLYIWGDNSPYYADANAVLNHLRLGIQLQGNDPGDEQVAFRQNGSGPGFGQHEIFTGIERLYEGITIARIVYEDGRQSKAATLMWSHHNQPVLAAIDIIERRQGKIVIDGGFTRLYHKWDTAGTARYVKNVAAWLCNFRQDWAGEIFAPDSQEKW